jgi:hypothetical protein
MPKTDYQNHQSINFSPVISQDCDTIVRISDGLFYAHKHILCIQSKVVEALFAAQNDHKWTIELNLTSQVMEHILEFLYWGRTEDFSSIATQLYCALKQYEI